MNIRRHLTRKNLLIAAGLSVSYAAILRWCENCLEPPGNLFSVLAPMCPESAPLPVALLPAMVLFLIGGWTWLIVAAISRLSQGLVRIARGGEK
jgi:hypothetical protein